MQSGFRHWESERENAERSGHHHLCRSQQADGAVVLVVLWDVLASLHPDFSGFELHTHTQVSCRILCSSIKKIKHLKCKERSSFSVFLVPCRHEERKSMSTERFAFNLTSIAMNAFQVCCSSLFILTQIFVDRTFKELSKPEEQFSLCRELCEDLAEDLKKEALKVRN